jgi:hypothetical protein
VRFASPAPWRVEPDPAAAYRPRSQAAAWSLIAPGGNVVAKVFDREDADAIVAMRNDVAHLFGEDFDIEIDFTPEEESESPYLTDRDPGDETD